MIFTVKARILLAFASVIFVQWHGGLRAQDKTNAACERPSAGSVVPEPEDLLSRNGVLQVDLEIHNFTAAGGTTRYCYVDSHGNPSPNLRLSPGDLLILRLKNDLTEAHSTEKHTHDSMSGGSGSAAKNDDACARTSMTVLSTNLHFHGLTIPAGLPSG